jgi:hypothetical protein
MDRSKPPLIGTAYLAQCGSERSTTSRKSYNRVKKEELRDTGVSTENTAPKAVADRMPGLAQIAAQRNANRTHTRIEHRLRHVHIWQLIGNEQASTCGLLVETRGFLLLCEREIPEK